MHFSDLNSFYAFNRKIMNIKIKKGSNLLFTHYCYYFASGSLSSVGVYFLFRRFCKVREFFPFLFSVRPRGFAKLRSTHPPKASFYQEPLNLESAHCDKAISSKMPLSERSVSFSK